MEISQISKFSLRIIPDAFPLLVPYTPNFEPTLKFIQHMQVLDNFKDVIAKFENLIIF